MNSAIRALGERLTQHLLRARRPGRDHHHLARMLLFLPQRLFERKRVRLVHLVRNIFANPRTRLIQLQRSVFLRHLLHANQNLHKSTPVPSPARLRQGKPVSINVHAGFYVVERGLGLNTLFKTGPEQTSEVSLRRSFVSSVVDDLQVGHRPPSACLSTPDPDSPAAAEHRGSHSSCPTGRAIVGVMVAGNLLDKVEGKSLEGELPAYVEERFTPRPLRRNPALRLAFNTRRTNESRITAKIANLTHEFESIPGS